MRKFDGLTGERVEIVKSVDVGQLCTEEFGKGEGRADELGSLVVRDQVPLVDGVGDAVWGAEGVVTWLLNEKEEALLLLKPKVADTRVVARPVERGTVDSLAVIVLIVEAPSVSVTTGEELVPLGKLMVVTAKVVFRSADG